MSGKPKAKIGDKFGFITLVSDTGKRTKQGNVIYFCKCECGKTFERSYDSIIQSVTKKCVISCGCKQREIARQIALKSNVSNNPRQKELAIESLKQYDGTCIVQLKRKKVNKNSTTGVRGVSFANDKKHKYRVRINLRRKEYFLGYANTLEEALEIRKRGEERLIDPVIEKYKEVTSEN